MSAIGTVFFETACHQEMRIPRESKKQDRPVLLPNVDRLSKYFH